MILLNGVLRSCGTSEQQYTVVAVESLEDYARTQLNLITNMLF